MMDNNNNNRRYNRGPRPPRGNMPTNVKRYDSKGMNNPRNFKIPRMQNHLLARLKKKYGENYVPIAHVNREFSNNPKIRGFIRDLFGGNVLLEEYAKDIMNPIVLTRMCEVAKMEYEQSSILANATYYYMMNPYLSAQSGFTPMQITQVADDFRVEFEMWYVIYASLTNAFNSANVQGGGINHIINGMAAIQTKPSPAHGKNVARDYIRTEGLNPRVDMRKQNRRPPHQEQ